MAETILIGDALEQLKTLPDQSVQCCITSPPYWGLRDYQTASWEGGDKSCDHIEPVRGVNEKEGTKQLTSRGTRLFQYKDVCKKCSAKRIDRQYGLEKTPEEYINHLVDVFREVRRVLRDAGTAWINIGDSYCGSGGVDGMPEDHVSVSGNNREKYATDNPNKKVEGLKKKDLVGIPWMLAFALRADGWYLRQDIIWAKPNPMPESVTDRCTKAHEYIFLLAKSQKYYYDAEAIKEPARYSGIKGMDGSGFKPPQNFNGKHSGGSQTLPPRKNVEGKDDGTRNKRSVWTVTTKPYKGAHFATFPPDLIEPCILAGTKEGDTILDPFAGSGTTGVVGKRYGRHSILIELSPEYGKLIEQRHAEYDWAEKVRFEAFL